MFDGYLAWITSVLVRTLGILVVQKEKQNIDMLPPTPSFLFLALARLDFTRLYSAMKTLVIINGWVAF